MAKKSTKAAMEQFKMEAAREVGVDLSQNYNGDITSKQAGSVGGQMVNLMMPEQQWKFQRINRNAYGHCTHITLSMVAGLQLKPYILILLKNIWLNN